MTANARAAIASPTLDGIVVLDGHDGAGKSTIVKLLRAELGGETVKPFNDSLGDMIVWLIARGRFDLANHLALQAVEKCQGESTDGLRWFDRHWLSLFTLLPERYYESWGQLPKTLLCWASPDVTIRRLEERGEPPGDIMEHSYYCRRYLDLAKRFDVPVLDTSHSTAEDAARAARKLLLR